MAVQNERDCEDDGVVVLEKYCVNVHILHQPTKQQMNVCADKCKKATKIHVK